MKGGCGCDTKARIQRTKALTHLRLPRNDGSGSRLVGHNSHARGDGCGVAVSVSVSGFIVDPGTGVEWLRSVRYSKRAGGHPDLHSSSHDLHHNGCGNHERRSIATASRMDTKLARQPV